MKKYAIVTGVASGIGECIANKFLEDDIYVFGVDINIPNNKKIDFFQCDIRNEKKVIEFIEYISKKANHIDYLINCAGIFCYFQRSTIENLALDEWQKVIDINLTGTFLITKYSIPLIKKSLNGNIINLSSEQVVSPQIKSSPYAISKAGVEMFSKILALELLNYKVRVNTIALASVETNFLKNYKKDENVLKEMMKTTDQNMPFGIIKPEDVYHLTEYLISENNKITGQTILIDSGVIINKNNIK